MIKIIHVTHNIHGFALITIDDLQAGPMLKGLTC
jgi:hypothetical protein